MAKTGLKLNQIKTYFKNKRSRTKVHEAGMNVTQEGEIDIMTKGYGAEQDNEMGEMTFGAFDADNIDFEINLSQFSQMIKTEPTDEVHQE